MKHSDMKFCPDCGIRVYTAGTKCRACQMMWYRATKMKRKYGD